MLFEDKDHVFPTLCLQIPSKAPGGNECSVNVGQINGAVWPAKQMWGKSIGGDALLPPPLAPLKAWNYLF